ncbi:MAG: hydroxymethylbilane synthase [Propionicimonas sp.]
MIRIATRRSELARTQSQLVADALTALTGQPCTLVAIAVAGDDVTRSLTGGPGIFTSALREALAEGRVDIAVHSFKDLPSEPDPALVVAAVPPRATPFDVLVAARPLADLPAGARVGTSSPRRAAALLRARPDLAIVPVRGNIDTRLRKVETGEVEALVLAAAGLERLGRLDAAVEVLEPAVMLPAPAQGALAVECRRDDPLHPVLAGLDDLPSRLAVTTERAVLRGITATCDTAIGALASFTDGRLTLSAELTGHAGVDYRRVDETATVGNLGQAEALGLAVAAGLLSHSR